MRKSLRMITKEKQEGGRGDWGNKGVKAKEIARTDKKGIEEEKRRARDGQGGKKVEKEGGERSR